MHRRKQMATSLSSSTIHTTDSTEHFRMWRAPVWGLSQDPIYTTRKEEARERTNSAEQAYINRVTETSSSPLPPLAYLLLFFFLTFPFGRRMMERKKKPARGTDKRLGTEKEKERKIVKKTESEGSKPRMTIGGWLQRSRETID